MKKLLSILLAIALVIAAVPFGAFVVSAESNGITGDCTWTLDGSTLTISGNGAMADYENYAGTPWYRKANNIVIEDGVTHIGNMAFYMATIRVIVVPKSVVSVGYCAFNFSNVDTVWYSGNEADRETIIDNGSNWDFFSAEWNYLCKNNEHSYGDNVCVDCGWLLKTGTTGNCNWGIYGTTLIIEGSGAMDDYLDQEKPWGTFIEKAIITDGVTNVGAGAFQCCDKLTSISIPNSVVSLGEGAFCGCFQLDNVSLPKNITKIEASLFNSCYALKEIIIPSTVTSIGSSAFADCVSLTSVVIPDGIKVIEEFTFFCCDKLENIVLPTSVKNIKNGNFTDFFGVDYPKNVYYLGSEEEKKQIIDENGNSGLTNANWRYVNAAGTTEDCIWSIKDTTLTISGNGETGYYDSVYAPTPWSKYYNDITDVVVEEGVTGIGPYTFMNLHNLMNVTLPNSLLEVGDGAFSSCSNLESIVIPDTVTVFGSAVFANCTNLKNVSLPYSVESDLMGIFQHCENLKTVILPYGITEIGDFAFWNCPSLEMINMNTLNSATKIGWQAFDECTNLTQIILPKSITEIDKYAFFECDNLTDVWYTGSESDRQNINIAEYNDALDKATWHYVDNAGVTGDCIWYLEGETLTIFGNGDMDDYTGKESGLLGIDSAPWFFNCDKIKHVVIEDGVTNIGQGAFAFYSNLETVTIPTSVTDIHNMAFVGCPALTINGHEGSYAQTYAVENNIPFVIIREGNTEVASGDPNGDGSINNKDLGLLMQYLNGWDVEITLDAADVNGDGNINNKDYGLLMQYINGWDVELK